MPVTYTDEELFEKLRDFEEFLERPPTEKDITEASGMPSTTTLHKRFGGVPEAREAAGLTKLSNSNGPVKELDDKELLEELIEEKELSVERVAEMYDRANNTVSKYCKKHDIETKNFQRMVKGDNNTILRKKKELQENDMWLCLLCETSFYSDEIEQTNLHHIRPRCLGGDDRIENYAPLCGECHIKKVHQSEPMRYLSIPYTREIVENHPLVVPAHFADILQHDEEILNYQKIDREDIEFETIPAMKLAEIQNNRQNKPLSGNRRKSIV